MKYVAEKQAASGRKIGPSGRPSATLGDLLKGKLDGIAPEDKAEEAASEDEGDTESE